jgi:hypothetical protein
MLLWKLHNAWYKDPVTPMEYHPIRHQKTTESARPNSRAELLAKVMAMSDGKRRDQLMTRLFGEGQNGERRSG